MLATLAAWLKVSSPRCLCFALGLGGGLRLHHTSHTDQMEARFVPSEREKKNTLWSDSNWTFAVNKSGFYTSLRDFSTQHGLTCLTDTVTCGAGVSLLKVD